MQKMKKAILYIHGKGGNAEEAEHYKPMCKDYDVYGLDYQITTPWETKLIFQAEYDALADRYDSVTVIANSIGAYFTMNALCCRKIERALFVSPIVNMEKLIRDMIIWANVSEAELKEKGEISTAFGETLSWQYLCYVREHTIVWNAPTQILYAGKDHLVSRETITNFAESHRAGLTVMENGEHRFHTEEQLRFLDSWVKSVL